MTTALLLVGCLTTPIKKADQNSVQFNKQNEQLIAQNMISALTQLLPKDKTTIAIDDTAFNAFYWRLLVEDGYALRVADITGDSFDDVLRIEKRTSDGKDDYLLSFNEIKLQREYAADAEKVYPVSPMFVTGAGSALISLDDQHFNADDEEGFLSSVVMKGTKDAKVIAMKSDARSYRPVTTEYKQPNYQEIPEVVMLSRSLTPIETTEPSQTQQDAESDNLPAIQSNASSDNEGNPDKTALGPVVGNPLNRNIFDLKQSNYHSLFEQYEDVHESTIIFDNDSFILGWENKLLVSRLTKKYNSETDVVSVVGCSNGKTSVGIDNSTLAIARANRVKEELMMAGVNGERVLEEACYSAEYADELGLPRRGVQVKIKRKKL